MDIGRLKNNYEYYDDSYYVDNDVILSLKETPEFNLHIEEGYFRDIFGDPIFDGNPWQGFTRDYCEAKGGWEKKTEIEDIDEYIDDMLRYADRQFSRKKPLRCLIWSSTFSPMQKQQGRPLL